MSDEPENSLERAKRRMRIVKRHVDALMEHFDCVQIFVTAVGKNDEGGQSTFGHVFGDGNFYARYGHVKEWVKRREAEFGTDNDDIPDMEDE